jgi:hypothetical protein
MEIDELVAASITSTRVRIAFHGTLIENSSHFLCAILLKMSIMLLRVIDIWHLALFQRQK